MLSEDMEYIRIAKKNEIIILHFLIRIVLNVYV